MQRGEWVVGNLGTRIGDRGNEGGLARIGHAQQTHVGQYLELQLEILALARPARCLLPRRAVDGALEAQVAVAAVATLGNGDHLTGRDRKSTRLNSSHLVISYAVFC